MKKHPPAAPTKKQYRIVEKAAEDESLVALGFILLISISVLIIEICTEAAAL